MRRLTRAAMIRIHVQRVNPYVEVKIVDHNLTLSLGLLSEPERDALAVDLLRAVFEMGCQFTKRNRHKWLDEMMERAWGPRD